ncbi:MAG: hypothetical protein GY757_19465 [bacterium]|nr:hypothetical protein [bacterium]
MINRQILIIILFISIVAGISGCNAVENLSNSSTKLILVSITGADLDGGTDSVVAFSDVITTTGTIYNDNGTVTLTAALINPLSIDNTYYNDVMIDQIDVSYTRTDRSTVVEGVDVPYGFSQQATTLLQIGETLALPFLLIQNNAKSERPLIELQTMGGDHILKLEAQVTVHAKDLGGNRLEPAKATLSVWCANFYDEN